MAGYDVQIFDDGSTLSGSGVATNSTDSLGSPGFNDFWQNLANQTLSLGVGYGRAKLQQNLNEATPVQAPARPLDVAATQFAKVGDPTLLLIGAGLVLYLLLKD